MKYNRAENGVHTDNGLKFIPNEPTNRDWIDYQEWLQQGNQPDPPLAKPDPEPVENVLISGIKTMSADDKKKLFEFLQEGLKDVS